MILYGYIILTGPYLLMIDSSWMIQMKELFLILCVLFAINLKTKNYEYENLYNSMVLEFNPLWNVDGVEGTIPRIYNQRR